VTWALITGGSRRVGLEMALTLAKQKKHIAIQYRSMRSAAEQAKELVQKHGVLCSLFQGDFSTPDGVQRFLETYHQAKLPTEILINNVGPYSEKSCLQHSQEELQKIYQTNFFAPFMIIQSLLPSLKKEKGLIINMGYPGLNLVQAKTKGAGYVFAKQSLFALTKSLAKELRSDRIRVNMISPGYLEQSIDLPKQLPQGRPVYFEEIADMVIYLCSEKGASITGQNIEIAGGVGL